MEDIKTDLRRHQGITFTVFLSQNKNADALSELWSIVPRLICIC